MFRDRSEAGRSLAGKLSGYGPLSPVVLALPRGGVKVAAEVARVLAAPLDVVVVRKIGHPSWPELAIGALAEGDVSVVVPGIALDDDLTERIAAARRGAATEIRDRAARYRKGRPTAELAGRTVIVVDDGIATGATARAACLSVRARGADHVVLAVPVAPDGWTQALGRSADEYVAVVTSGTMTSVGEFYVDFDQVDDDEVTRLLAEFDPVPSRSTEEGQTTTKTTRTTRTTTDRPS